jgi:hypothetical protein
MAPRSHTTIRITLLDGDRNINAGEMQRTSRHAEASSGHAGRT